MPLVVRFRAQEANANSCRYGDASFEARRDGFRQFSAIRQLPIRCGCSDLGQFEEGK